MDVAVSTSPVPSAAAVDKAEAADARKDTAGSTDAAAPFAQLLQGAQQPLDEGMAQPPLVPVNTAPLGDVQDPALLTADASLQSLIGQTALLDGGLERALQDGSVVQLRQDAGLLGAAQSVVWGAQPHMAAGHTVAAGVQPAAGAASDAPMAAAMAVTAQASGAGDAVLESAQALMDDALERDVTAGRWALQGAWTLDEAQPPAPAMQRLMAHVEQWAAAAVGAKLKPTERGVDSGNAVTELAAAASGQHTGSGTRLTEQAVREAQLAPDAAWDNQQDAAVQDMRFWLQGKQQRAELVLEQDGQPVRVQVSLRGNEAHVTFQSEQANTRAWLDGSLAQLRELLEQQGMQLGGVQVQADGAGQGPAGEGAAARNPWEPGGQRVLHGQVDVAQALASAQPAAGAVRAATGIDLYA